MMVAVATICSCTDKLFEENANPYSFKEGDVVECLLKMDVGEFKVAGGNDSRAATDTIATDAEKRISNFWVFQYDNTESHNLLINPRYYTGNSLHKDTLKAVFSVNQSTIYVVANTNDSTWASNTENFKTLDLLKQQTLSGIQPIIVGDSVGQTKADSVVIPMCGGIDVTDVSAFSQWIIVPVERMFAKLTIKAKMLNDMDITDIEVNNIPDETRIESRSCDDDTSAEDKVAATYPSTTNFITRSYNTVKDGTQTNSENNKYKDTTKDYIIYVPENIQGDNGNTSTTTIKNETTNYLKNPSAPAITVKFHLRIKDGTETVVTSATVYPGSNTYSNFNVKRNRVYNIVSNFNSKEYFFPTPSSNCFVVEPGDTLTFWPYYRTEVGGGYAIKTYLYPDGSDTEIKSVSIIWQDKDVIGDNSDGEKVKLSLTDASKMTADELVNKIRINVATKGEGNALIGAYNAKGDTIWSWHIWVTDNHPDNVGNAIRYTTYSWDEKGIKANPKNPASATRVPGYQVMPCNLGALEFVPTNNDPTVTYGPLYQWGRKDPFPTMKVKDKDSGVHKYSNDPNDPNDGSNIKVYDNSNQLIEMTTNGTADQSKDTELFRTVKYDKTYVDGSIDGLKYSIRNPTTFISAANCVFDGSSSGTYGYNVKDNYANNGDWLKEHDDKLWGGETPTLETKHYRINMQYAGGPAADDQIPYVWDNYGSEKSIFDPCPTGWRVPPSDLWMGFTSTGESVHQNNSTSQDFDSFVQKVNTTDTDKDINSNNGFYMFLDGWKTGSTTFFPCPGLRLASGQPFHFSFCGNYHNATSAPMISNGNISYNDRVNCLHFHSQTTIDQVNVFERQRLFVYKSIAGPIRCVRDKK